MENDGPLLKRPYVDSVYGSRYANMKELRVIEPPIRIFFAFDPRRVAILLIGGDRSCNKRFYNTMIAAADRLYGEHLADLEK